MKKIAFVSAAVLAAAFSSQALAAPPTTTDKPAAASTTAAPKVVEKTTKGEVDSYAADTRMLKLKAGDEFKVADKVKSTNFTAGEKVTVRWTEKDGAKVADRVTAAAAKPKAKPS